MAAAVELSGPVAVKGLGVAHKTDHRAVHLGLTDPTQVGRAAAELLTRCPAVLVEEMVTGGLAELLVGVEADPVFGPVLTLGAGGVHTELWRDVAHLVLPTGPAAIRDALAGLRCAPLLTGFRGSAPVDLDALAGVVHRVAELATAGVRALEVNPMIVTAAGVWACDALVVREEEER